MLYKLGKDPCALCLLGDSSKSSFYVACSNDRGHSGKGEDCGSAILLLATLGTAHPQVAAVNSMSSQDAVAWGNFNEPRPILTSRSFPITYNERVYISIRTESGPQSHLDGLVQDYSNFIANALELLQSCTKPSIWSV